MEIWGEGLVGSEKWTREQTHNGHIGTESFLICVHLAFFKIFLSHLSSHFLENGNGYTIAQQKALRPVTSYA